MFNIKSIPTLVFFPVGEQIFNKVGTVSKAVLEKLIKENLKIS